MGQKPGSKAEGVLLELCTKFGYCLPSGVQAELLAGGEWSPTGLVDAVILAEGLEPSDVGHRSEMVEVAERILGADS